MNYRNVRTTKRQRWTRSPGPNRRTRRWRSRWSRCCSITGGTNSPSSRRARGRRWQDRWRSRPPRTTSPWTTTRPWKIDTRAARKGCRAVKSAYGSNLYRRPKIWPGVSPSLLYISIYLAGRVIGTTVTIHPSIFDLFMFAFRGGSLHYSRDRHFPFLSAFRKKFPPIVIHFRGSWSLVGKKLLFFNSKRWYRFIETNVSSRYLTFVILSLRNSCLFFFLFLHFVSRSCFWRIINWFLTFNTLLDYSALRYSYIFRGYYTNYWIRQRKNTNWYLIANEMLTSVPHELTHVENKKKNVSLIPFLPLFETWKLRSPTKKFPSRPIPRDGSLRGNRYTNCTRTVLWSHHDNRGAAFPSARKMKRESQFPFWKSVGRRRWSVPFPEAGGF